ncbi:flavin reductase family protein [Noviherbaspirillum saxi]|uniref:Flavin reductase n=1 Tax=Noviherbaspirillum saxi TaxID=2320863 RepID=A0A3A3FGK0_9BURK|nr:flavin reductase family protein [Noviherbaspirillum saxi]RJF92247.1 flavin reductase [Noviherbaspirillum saxi]
MVGWNGALRIYWILTGADGSTTHNDWQLSNEGVERTFQHSQICFQTRQAAAVQLPDNLGMQIQIPPFDTRELRSVFGKFVTGVTVITTVDACHKAHGLTVNSFVSVSLDPPLVLWSQSKRAASYPTFMEVDEFAVSILSEEHIGVATTFAKPHPDKFADVRVNRAFCGLPVIEDSCAWLYCRTITRVEGGDHTVHIAEVIKAAKSTARPLVFGAGEFLAAQPLSIT